MFGITRIWSTSVTTRRALPLMLAALLLATLCVANAPRVHAAAATMVVDATTDGDVGDAVLTLHEAMKLATGTLSVGVLTAGECDQVSGNNNFTPPPCSTTDTIGAGSADTIIFDTSTFPPDTPATITLATGTPTLPTLNTGGDTVSGVGAGVIVDGQVDSDCFLISGESSDSNVIKGLQITGCLDGIEISGGADSNTIGGTNVAESTCTGSADDDADGYRNDGCPTVTGSPEGPKCLDGEDDDGDTLVNDGCPAVGAAESGGQCSDSIDDDADTWVNDGCPVFAGTTEGAQCLNALDDDGDATVNDGCLARGGGNVIYGNNDGVRISGSTTTSNIVSGNLIGTDFDGIDDAGNTTYGIVIGDSSNSAIGGTTGGQRNVISGNNSNGVIIQGATATGNTLLGNYIGTNARGTAAIANGARGIEIESSSNTIGGTTVGHRNVISGNGDRGIAFEGAGTTGNVVQGNYVGVGADGTTAIPNTFQGVWLGSGTGGETIGGTAAGAGNLIASNGDHGIGILTNSNVIQGNTIRSNGLIGLEDGIYVAGAGNTIGGAASGASNLIFSNGGNGIQIVGSTASSNVVRGNTIGVGNGLNGVLISEASSNTIGGTGAGDRNVISGNAGHGIVISGGTGPATGNVVQGNYIGTDSAGTVATANSGDGVAIISAASNTIGGTTSAARNVISGNGGDGVRIITAAATGNFVQGNFIGTNAAGSGAMGNGGSGVYIEHASSNTVGGLAATTGVPPGNVISANASGILIKFNDADNNIVRGNLIGTNAAGTADLGNADVGVYLSFGPDNTLIGGTASGARNVISGNNNRGVAMFEDSIGTLVEGNYIGTDITGTAAIGSLIGVTIANGASYNTIGGTTAASRNVISGNTQYGINIGEATAADFNSVAANYIGVNAAGTGALGNGTSAIDHGVYIATGSSNCIGGTIIVPGCTLVAATGNVIANSTGDGVYVAAGTGNNIRGNSIYANSGLGIDLGTDGVTVNDGPSDPDTGANNLMNFPTVLAAAYDGVHTTISGELDSTPNLPSTVDVYATDVADPSGNGEGRAFLGSATTAASAPGAWTLAFSGAPPFGRITGTATDAGGNTSEFSASYAPKVGPGLPFTTIAHQGLGTPIGGTFNTFGPGQVPSTSGNVVFWATINGLPLIPHGIFSSPAGGPITKLVAVGDATPLGGVFFSLGASPVNNEAGKVAFWASVDTDVNGFADTEGIFLWSPGPAITKIVASGESTPIGGTAYVSFQPPAGSPVAVLNNGGDISFWASVADCCGVYEGVFLYSAAGPSVSKVAAIGDLTPEGYAFSTFVSPGGYATIPIVTDQQKVAFRGFTTGGSTSGIFFASGTTLTTVALAGGSTPLGGSYTGFGRAPSPNESGEVAFFATMSGSSAGVCASYSAPCAVFLRDSDGAISKTLAGGDSGPAGVGGTIGDLATAPFMNDSRQVSVWAGISNGFGSPPATQALVRYTPGEALANVAAVGNVIPLPIDSTFDTFTDASLFPTSPIPNNLGQVAFWGHGSEGIFLTDPPPPGPVITQGPVEGATAPGTSGGEFGNTFDLDIDNNGEAVFANTVTGSASGVTSGIFAFFAGTAVRDVALEGDSAPEGGQFDNFFPPYSNDNGTIVARATTVSPAGEGLYAFFAGSPDAVAVSGDTIPAGQGGGTLTSFSDPSINNSGYVAARGTLTSGQGLYIFFAGSPGSPDSPVKVFKSGEAAPGGGGNFSTFGRPALSDFNDVAVKATLSGGGQGLYAFFAGVPQKLARTNDTADANNRVFTDFGDPVLNIDRAVVFTATFTESGGPSQMGLFAFFAGSPTAQLIADTDLGSPAPSVPPSIGGQFTEFFSPAVTDGTSPVAVARATITGGSASEGLFVFFAGSVVKLVGQGDMITDTTSDTDDAFGPPTPVFPYHAINNGRKVVFVANVVNSATTQGVYFASLDYDNDGVLDFLDNCPSTFNTVQHDTDEDGPGNPCDNCPSAGNTSQQNSDADSFGNVCDNCPTVTNQNQANLDGDPLGDVCDLDDDADKVFDADEGPCGGDSLNAAKQPERLDTPGDDDLDGLFNEGLPSPASDGFDCDGDGWKGNQENLIFSAGTTANDQDPCGNTGWGSDLVGNNILNIADIGSFLTPARSNDGHGTFNKFGHPLDDTAPPGIDAVMARWNLSLPPHDPATQINIADLNALIAGAAGSPARPPMFNGQIAFFTSGGMCPYPQ